jgi:hypothetical protein
MSIPVLGFLDFSSCPYSCPGFPIPTSFSLFPFLDSWDSQEVGLTFIVKIYTVNFQGHRNIWEYLGNIWKLLFGIPIPRFLAFSISG